MSIQVRVPVRYRFEITCRPRVVYRYSTEVLSRGRHLFIQLYSKYHLYRTSTTVQVLVLYWVFVCSNNFIYSCRIRTVYLCTLLVQYLYTCTVQMYKYSTYIPMYLCTYIFGYLYTVRVHCIPPIRVLKYKYGVPSIRILVFLPARRN